MRSHTLDLTDDEVIMLRYALDDYSLSGEPLKNVYEIEEDVLGDPYATFELVVSKAKKLSEDVRKGRKVRG